MTWYLEVPLTALAWLGLVALLIFLVRRTWYSLRRWSQGYKERKAIAWYRRELEKKGE